MFVHGAMRAVCRNFLVQKTHNHFTFKDIRSSQTYFFLSVVAASHGVSLFPSNLIVLLTLQHSVLLSFFIIFILVVSHVPYITYIALLVYRNYFTFKYRGIECRRQQLYLVSTQTAAATYKKEYKMIYPKKGSQRLTRYA